MQHKKIKLADVYIQKIIELAEDKTTSSISSSRIQKYIYLKLKKDKINITVPKFIICRILKEECGRTRKIKKVFFLNKKQKKTADKILQNGFKKKRIKGQ